MTKEQGMAMNYLSGIRETEKKIHSKRLELEALRWRASGAGGIQYDKDHVQSSPGDYLAMAMADIIEIEKYIAEAESNIEKRKGKAYSVVRQMDKEEQRAFVEWYYLNGLSMIETATRMNIAERTTYYLRDDALESFGRLL